MTEKTYINLLQPELFPEKPLLTLGRVFQVWLLVAVVLVSVAYASQYFMELRTEKVNKLISENNQKNTQMAQLQQKLSKHKPSSLLVSKLETLKLVMDNKEELHHQLTNVNTTYVAGFSQAMTDLSTMHSRDISLQKVSIDHDDMILSGMAKAPESVPSWLALFESSTILSGKVFSHFTLSQNESNYIDFNVSTIQVREQ